MPTALRIGAIVCWIAWLFAMASWSATTPALLGAILGTFALGLLAGRWWVVLAVVIPGLVLALMFAAGGTEDTGHGSGVDWALWLVVPATILVGALVALGVLCRRLVLRARRPRPGRGALPAR